MSQPSKKRINVCHVDANDKAIWSRVFLITPGETFGDLLHQVHTKIPHTQHLDVLTNKSQTLSAYFDDDDAFEFLEENFTVYLREST